MQKLYRPEAKVSPQDRNTDPATPCVIAIGELSPENLPSPTGQTVVFSDLDGITADLLASCRPVLVVSPLVGAGLDCFDVAERLSALGYSGRYRAVVDTLPDPSVVRREIRGHFPDLDFDILVLS